MDPQATFEAFRDATGAWDLDIAASAESDYSTWRAGGGFAATDEDGAEVLRLDLEQDRYLVDDDGIEAWRSVG